MLRASWLAALAGSVLALAQNPSQQPPQNGNSNSTAPNPVPRIRPSLDSPGLSSDPSGKGHNAALDPISGRVVLSDGGDPGQGVRVQRACGSTVAGEASADSRGRFMIARTNTNPMSADPGTAGPPSVGGCELRVSLSGYQTATLSLANRRSGEAPDIGVLVLHRVGASQGMTITATTLLAPKEARKSYQKGIDAIAHNLPDRAQKDFAEAVRIYPRFAAAWLELGKVFEHRERFTEARSAYARSIAADPEYLFPSERLYLLDVKQAHWQEAADTTTKVLRLNPYDFSGAYYFNAVSNLALHHLDAAEHSAREAAKLEGPKAEPRANYVLGVILWQRGDLAGAADRLHAFLDAPTSGPEHTSAQKMITQIESQIARTAP